MPVPEKGERADGGWAGARPHRISHQDFLARPPHRIFPDLSSNDMLLFIVKGINLPTPPGVAAARR